jgi:hypothetical protein
MKAEMIQPLIMNEDELYEDGTLNPFHQDIINMGTRLGKNVIVMHQNHDNDEAKFLTIVNTKTGERMRITFD